MRSSKQGATLARLHIFEELPVQTPAQFSSVRVLLLGSGASVGVS